MTAYLWHLPLLVAVIGTMLLLRVPFPAAGSAAWWATRPLWLVALTGLLVGALSLASTSRGCVRCGSCLLVVRGEGRWCA